jgi:porphobilinogen synthase
MVRETSISANNFIYPLFIMDDKDSHKEVKVEIASMPDCYRHNLKSMIAEVKDARR